MSDFHLWLDQCVWVTGDSKLPRREYIPHFTQELTNFMKKAGYTMDGRWGPRALAKWMYSIHFQERHNRGVVQNPTITHRNWDEDYDEYLHIMDYDKVSNFLKRWRLYEDLDLDSHIGQRMLEISAFLYCYINMDASKNGRRMADLLYETDSDGEGGRREDIYITDSREGHHGGDGYKV